MTEQEWIRIAAEIDAQCEEAEEAGYPADLNPQTAEDGTAYCGPTTGGWIEANGLSRIETRYTPNGRAVTFAE